MNPVPWWRWNGWSDRTGTATYFFWFSFGCLFRKGSTKTLDVELWVSIRSLNLNSCPFVFFFIWCNMQELWKENTFWMSVSNQRRRKMKKDSFSGFAHDLKIFHPQQVFRTFQPMCLPCFKKKTRTTHCQPSEAQNGQKLKGTSWPLVLDLFGRSRVSESSICNERKIQQKSHRNILGFTFWKSSQPQQKTLDLQQKSHFDLFKMRVF